MWGPDRRPRAAYVLVLVLAVGLWPAQATVQCPDAYSQPPPGSNSFLYADRDDGNQSSPRKWFQSCSFVSSDTIMVCSPEARQRMLKYLSGFDYEGKGPHDLTPCDFYEQIRGRTLWLLGDSASKVLFHALRCFLFDLWTDAHTHPLSDDPAAIANVSSLPRTGSTDAECVHLPDSTRLCLVKCPLGWQLFPGATSQPYATPVLPELRRAKLMHGQDISVVGIGLWYSEPAPYEQDVRAGSAFFRSTEVDFPHYLFFEATKSHWDSLAGDYGPASEPCQPTKGVKIDPPSGGLYVEPKAELSLVERQAAVINAAGGFRNQVLRAMSRRDGVPLVPVYNETVPLWWAHYSNDCLHYCQGGVPQLMVWRLWKALRRHVPTLRGSA